MRIELTRASNDRHRLTCTRADGSVESALLETRSYLLHDLTHLAYEQELVLTHSFWGLLAAGKSFAALREPMTPEQARPDGAEAYQTEMVVGVLQTVMESKRTPAEALELLSTLCAGYGAEAPGFVTEEAIGRVRERYHRLMGEWRGTGRIEVAF